jgi:NAD(P)-dependent dehydrogenase (short-subunit alcohol dehydrogenase family)
LALEGRVVLVTGGTRGVGLGISEAFLDAGATLVTCSRSEVTDPPGSRHLVCDVRSPESVEAMVAAVVEQHGRLDVVVNNAGGAPYALAAEASARFHAKVTELNLLAPLLLSQAANAVMQGQPDGGVIVNVSSVSALRPSPGTAAYGASKAGLDSLTRTLAVEWAPKVRVVGMDVGLVQTEQSDLHYGGDLGLAAAASTVPLGRLATPRDVGNVAAFLASPLASYVSGTSIEVHGGGEAPAFLAAVESATRTVAQTATQTATQTVTQTAAQPATPFAEAPTRSTT